MQSRSDERDKSTDVETLMDSNGEASIKRAGYLFNSVRLCKVL